MTEQIAESEQALALLNNQEAPGISPKEGLESAKVSAETDSDSDDDSSVVIETDDEETPQAEGLSYRDKLAYKTLTLYLEREDRSNDFVVSNQEAAELIFKRLNVPKGMLVSIDTTPYKKIVLELDTRVKERELNLTQALQIRPGLWTKPLQAPEKDRKVNIRWANMKMSNKEIQKVIAIFGDVTSDVDHVTLWKGAEAWTEYMDGVKTSDRTCRMKIEHQIPSMIMVRGVKLRVDYAGQNKTCSRCFKYWGACPGDGKADKCKKAGGEEVKLSVAFRKLIKKLKKGPAKDKASKVVPVVPAFIPDPDIVRFSGFAEDMTLATFKEWLDGNKITYLDPMCFQGKKPGTFSIETIVDEAGTKCNIDSAEAEELVAKLNGQNFNKRMIMVTMGQMTTPEKSKKNPEVVTLNSSNEDGASPGASAQLALPAPGDKLPSVPEEPEPELPKTPERSEEMPSDQETPAQNAEKEVLKMKILREVTATGTVTHNTERIVGNKNKRADTSGSSLDGSPELPKPPKKKGGGKNKSKK